MMINLGKDSDFTTLAGSKRKEILHLLHRVKYLFLAAIFSLAGTINAQYLQTQGGFTATQLVQDVLLGGGVQLVSVNFQGANYAIGTFNGASSNIGLSEGVVMTTGTITGPNGPAGPNNQPDAGMDNGTAGYSLLSSIIGENTFNATVIQFTFIPSGDSINFRYVFGSEEYKEFVGTQYNDVFGFFLTGPNPLGGNYNNQNLAVIPSTSTTVAINNVNHQTNTSYYVDNEALGGNSVQYDGFTTVLTASASVIPCSTYTITLAIADVADGIYDSGVFLEAKSFSSNGIDVSHEVINSFSPDSLYESCGQAEVTFTITGNTSVPNTINYQILGTATNGVDYNIAPGGTSITIPAGQNTGTITVTPVNDGIPEGLEYIVIQVIDTLACPGVELPSDTVWLVNVEPIQVTARPDTTLDCNNVVMHAYANTTGGAGNITLSWNQSLGQGNYIPFIAKQTQTYVVTATDQCGNSAVDSFTVFVPNVAPLVLSFSNDTSICPGSPVTLNASASGGIGDLNLAWSTGDKDITSILVNPFETTLYSIIVTDSCGNSVTDGALVTVLAPGVTADYMYKDNRKIQFFSTPSHDVETFLWDFGDGNTSTEQNPEHTYADSGYYNVILVVTNEFGCTDTAELLIYAYPDFRFFIPNTFTPNGDGLNDVFTGAGMGFAKYEMRIFDRWGVEIYFTTDIDRGWPGTDKANNKQPIGVYAYRIELTTPADIKHRYIGHVNLLR